MGQRVQWGYRRDRHSCFKLSFWPNSKHSLWGKKSAVLLGLGCSMLTWSLGKRKVVDAQPSRSCEGRELVHLLWEQSTSSCTRTSLLSLSILLSEEWTGGDFSIWKRSLYGTKTAGDWEEGGKLLLHQRCSNGRCGLGTDWTHLIRFFKDLELSQVWTYFHGNHKKAQPE